MNSPKHINLSDASYGDVKDHEYNIAILPWGATEPHNYHLPYLTDSILSHAISVDAATKALEDGGINAMVLPPVNCGSQNPGQHQLKFCIHYRYETQKAILTDTVAALQRQGIDKLIIVNGHGGNVFKNMIRDLYIDFPNFTIAATEWFTIVNPKEYFSAEIDDHAGETETSVMMYYYPDRANLHRAGDGRSTNFALESLKQKTAWTPRDWSKTTTDSGVGDPKLATAEKGEKFAKKIVEKLSKLLIEISTENLY